MWNQRYSEEGWAFGTEPNDFLKAEAAAIPAGRVLCLGEGEGRNAVYLAGLGHQVTGVDAAEVGLKKAHALAAERGLSMTTEVADLADYEIQPGAWQGIVSVFVHLPPPVRQAVHRRCVQGLAPGGVLLLESYTPRQLEFGTGGPPRAELMFTLDMLREEFADLELKVARELERDVFEGRYHHGRAAVVQVLGVKP